MHVDDVARAHIFLLEHSNPHGRYNCSSCLVTVERISELVSAKYPEFQLPTGFCCTSSCVVYILDSLELSK